MDISFIIPTYNSSNFVIETLKSVVNGNLDTGDEIVIIDDASSDDTVDKINYFKKNYPLMLLRHQKNKGSAAASRNTGIQNATNKIYFCLDSDNILVPNSVSKLKHYMTYQKADAVSFGELWFFKHSVDLITHKWIFKKGAIGLNDAFAGSVWPGPSGNYMFTRQSWFRAGKYNEDVGSAIDSWAFGVKQLVTGTKMVGLPNTHYLHRYGYFSAYVRDSQKGNRSIKATKFMKRYLSLLNNKDRTYIQSIYGRENWFDQIEFRPIKLEGKIFGENGKKLFISRKDRYEDIKMRTLNKMKYFYNKFTYE